MIIESLRLAQFRAFEEAEFAFQPGMNLLVGINGVGKTTVLDALRILLSQTLPEFYSFRAYRMPFQPYDITLGRDFLTARIGFIVGGTPYTYVVDKRREQYTPNPIGAGQVRSQTFDKSEKAAWLPDKQSILKKYDTLPQAVYFSSERSLIKEAVGRGDVNPQSASYRDALESRGLRVQELADWWLTREALANEGLSSARPLLDALNETVSVFLDGFSSLRAVRTDYGHNKTRADLLIEKHGVTLNVRQLSDGERGVLALVADLTRRLALANPRLDNPAQEAQAVVLIDELDLHLHPKWQRLIVERLTKTFPNCQFIASTHSPQVIGETRSNSITVIEYGGEVSRPEQSFGMDTNWVLRTLMDADDRDPEIQQGLNEIFLLLQRKDLNTADEKINLLKEAIGGTSEDLQRASGIIQRIRLMGR